MPHTAGQKTLAALGRLSGLSNDQIKRNDSSLFPTRSAISSRAIRTAEKNQALFGNAARRKRRVDKGSVADAEGVALLRALAEDSTRHTAAGSDTLIDNVRSASGRTLKESTVNDWIRAVGVTDKVAERVNPRRDPFESAEVRTDLQSYPLSCIVNIDATNIADADFDRRRGRAPAGQRAQLRTERMGSSGLRCLYAAMNIDGMVEGACRIIDGAVDGETFMDYVYINLVPVLRRCARAPPARPQLPRRRPRPPRPPRRPPRPRPASPRAAN